MSKQATNALVHEQQIDAIKRLYAREITDDRFGSQFPSLSHQKKHILAVVAKLPSGLATEALHRECCKLLKLPVPDRMYSDAEMREALEGYHFRSVDKLTIATFTDKFGPSKPTLFRQQKRLVDALKLAGVCAEPKAATAKAQAMLREQVRGVIAAMTFDVGGRPALFLPDEESLLLETMAQRAEVGGGKGKRLQVSHCKRMAAEMAADSTLGEAERVQLGNAKLSRQWLADARERERKRNGGEDPYVDKKQAKLSQKRAASKKPGQNAAMFQQIQDKYDELGAAGKLVGCQRADGHYEAPAHLCYGGDEMGIEPNGKLYVPVLARKGAGKIHRVVTGEHNPFWVTLFFWSRFDGNVDIPPCVIHKAAVQRGDLVHGLPVVPGKEWLARASDSGYLTKDDWYLICCHLKMHIVHRPAFVFIDGFANHFDEDAIKTLVEDDIYVFVLKSQGSEEDQVNDNGPNRSIKTAYGHGYNDWLDANPGVPFSPFFLNPILVGAWDRFTENAKPIIVNAARRCGLSPLNPNAENFQGSDVSRIYELPEGESSSALSLPSSLASSSSSRANSPFSNLKFTETSSKMTLIQLKAEAPDKTLVLRTAAANFLEKSFITPAQKLHEVLKLQRELKQQTVPLDIDRTEPINTAVGRWLTSNEIAIMASNKRRKDERAEKAAANRTARESARAVTHVQQLTTGEQALAKLRANANAKLSNTEMMGAITKLGGKAKGKKAALQLQLQKLIDKHGLPALPPPAPLPPPPPSEPEPAVTTPPPSEPEPAVTTPPPLAVSRPDALSP